MRFIIITGLSGAGKTDAVRVMEDMGYFVVDNMLPEMLLSFAEIAFGSQGKLDKIALVCDIRSGENFQNLAKATDELANRGYNFEILFLDARDDVLIKRYKETRRKHPFSEIAMLHDAIAQERKLLEFIKKKANYIIDTSDRLPSGLRKELEQVYAPKNPQNGMIINIVSFGYKYGIPLESDLVFDVRFLPNPFYIPELKKQNGTQKDVVDFVMRYPQTKTFLGKLQTMVDFLIPLYEEEGKSQLVISIGCTGGQHRSTALANALFAHLEKEGHQTYLTHRESPKWPLT